MFLCSYLVNFEGSNGLGGECLGHKWDFLLLLRWNFNLNFIFHHLHQIVHLFQLVAHVFSVVAFGIHRVFHFFISYFYVWRALQRIGGADALGVLAAGARKVLHRWVSSLGKNNWRWRPNLNWKWREFATLECLKPLKAFVFNKLRYRVDFVFYIL